MSDIFSTIEKIATGKGFARTGELDKDCILLESDSHKVAIADTGEALFLCCSPGMAELLPKFPGYAADIYLCFKHKEGELLKDHLEMLGQFLNAVMELPDMQAESDFMDSADQMLCRARILARWDNSSAIKCDKVDNLASLRVRFFMPWEETDDDYETRHDADNGLPLSGRLSALYTEGLFSLSELSRILVSPDLSKQDKDLADWLAGSKLSRNLTGKQRKYTAQHRKKYGYVSGGRNAPPPATYLNEEDTNRCKAMMSALFNLEQFRHDRQKLADLLGVGWRKAYEWKKYGNCSNVSLKLIERVYLEYVKHEGVQGVSAILDACRVLNSKKCFDCLRKKYDKDADVTAALNTIAEIIRSKAKK